MAYTLLNPYCSVAELIEELKMTAANVPAASAIEDELKRAIVNASRWIDDFMRKDFFFHDYSVTPLVLDQFSDGVFDKQIFLPYSPVITLTSITSGDVALVADTDFTHDATRGIIHSLCGVWRPLRPGALLSINGTFGYAQATTADVPTGIPGHITHATRLVAAAFSGHNRTQVAGLDGQAQMVNVNEIPKTVFQVLGRRAPILV